MNEYYNQEYRDTFGEYDDQSRICLSWEDLKYQSPKNRGIWGMSSPSKYEEKLGGIWGGAGPGEIVSILGEFKSGKSMFLNILSGNIKLDRGDLLTGRVLVNGFQRGQRWRRICAHVCQSREELNGLLTVKEQLKFRAELALSDEWTGARREEVVNWVLKWMDLEYVKLAAVDNLTACEKRRLTIGLALVGLPRVLLLDEPLEGLDPTRALELMKSLRRITQQRQMTTIITTKQLRESTLPLVDRILILAKGSTVYYGTFSDSISYFKTRLGLSISEKGDNPLNYMLDAVSCIHSRRDPNHIARIHQEWKAYAFENQLYRTNYPSVLLDDNDQFGWNRDWLTEFKEQFLRSFALFIRNRLFSIGQTGMTLILALFVAFSAFQLDKEDSSVRARFNALYYTAALFQLFPFVLFIQVCYRDKWVLQRERRDSLVRVSPAYLAEWLLIYSFRFLLVTLYTCIVYFIVGLRLPFNYTLVFWLALLAEAWVAMGMAYLVVSFVENIKLGEILATMIVWLCILYSGDFAYNPECTWILKWIAYLSPVFYAFDALISNEFDGKGGKGEENLNLFYSSGYGVWPSIGTLLGIGLLYMIIGYFGLSFSTRTKRIYI